jgi:hypothetical protein
LALIAVAPMGPLVSTKTCSNNMASPIDNVSMNCQNRTRTNGLMTIFAKKDYASKIRKSLLATRHLSSPRYYSRVVVAFCDLGSCNTLDLLF